MIKSFVRVISAILIACFIINSNMYLNVYANPAAIAGTIEYGGEVITFTAEAIALFTAQMHNAGIDIDLNEAWDAFEDYFDYHTKSYDFSEVGFSQWCRDNDFQYNPDTKTVTARDGFIYYVYYDPVLFSHDVQYRVDTITGPLNLGQLDDGEFISRLKDYTTSNGTRVKTAVKTSYDTLTNIGANLYDYLHNSDTVEFVPPQATSAFGTLTSDEFYPTALDISVQNFCSYVQGQFSPDGTSLEDYMRDFLQEKKYDFLCPSNPCNFRYMDVYVLPSSCDYVDDELAYYLCLVFVYYNEKISELDYGTDYAVRGYYTHTRSNYDTRPFMSFSSLRVSDVSKYASISDINLGYAYSNNEKYIAHIEDFFKIGVYANTDLVSDIPADDPSATDKPKIKVGEHEYEIDNTRPNAWDTPDSLTTAVAGAGAFDDSDETLMTLPGVVDNAWDWDEADALPDVLNPDATDVSTEVPESVASSDNVLDWVKDFFTNFFERLAKALKELLKGLFIIDDDFLPFWYSKFQEVFSGKGYQFDFSYLQRSNENSIPDIYINWKGIKILFMPSKYIYSCSQFVRPYIRAFIYFLLLLHDRKRLIYLIRGKLPPDSEFEVPPM